MAANAVSKPRRAKGEGSLTQLPDGRWMGRYWVTKSDGSKKQQSITLKDKERVLEKMRYEKAMADRGSPILRDKHTTGEYLEHWLRHIAPNQLRPSTWELYRFDTEKYLIPQLGHIPLTRLGPQHIRMMLNGMQAGGAGFRTLQRVRNTLSAALREAVNHEYVTRNVAKLVATPKYTAPEKQVWSKEQVTTFLERGKHHKHYPMFMLMLCCGLRRGEALGLRWQDVDFDNEVIYIRQTINLLKGELVVGQPKTRASIRDIPMPRFIKTALLEHRRILSWHKDDLVFHTNRGNPVDPRSLIKSFQRLAQRMGLPPITLHEARHTAATLLAEVWPNPKEAQMILGHSSITTTLQIYTHSNLKKKADALGALARSVALPGSGLEESIVETPIDAPTNVAQVLYRTA
ncbi:MAG: site-specific integrase [Oscillospiraceae bacterium]|jgi:integrase|nr:site-specific integrase [Oscillospiraceae bacterium]